MRFSPAHIWWLGVGLFTPSALIWCMFVSVYTYKGWINFSLDGHSLTHFYLPMLGAFVGLTVPLLLLRPLRCAASGRFGGCFFFGYLAIMLTWAIVDIRREHYQVGGHDYSDGVLATGHTQYWHLYYTWYFMPYKWIEHGVDE